jgi:hypothetical protein
MPVTTTVRREDNHSNRLLPTVIYPGQLSGGIHLPRIQHQSDIVVGAETVPDFRADQHSDFMQQFAQAPKLGIAMPNRSSFREQVASQIWKCSTAPSQNLVLLI